MVKSNKFDYTNRSSCGPKLGQIISTALRKEAEKVKKDADRHLQKARKQSTGSISGLADIVGTTHIIDLRAPGKDLGDEGVDALLEGLEISLRSGNSEASLALEDLNLSANNITTASLLRLAPVISLAKHHLRTLNLADNNIKVETYQQAEQWESFLIAFNDCQELRRLDLSGNNELGSRALEILARVYIFEDRTCSTGPHEELSNARRSSQDDNGNGGLSTQHDNDVESLSARSNESLATFHCGLQSVPHITLHRIGLDEFGAMWLSYVLERHPYPSQLMDDAVTSPCESSSKATQQNAESSGLEWSDNSTLGKAGTHLLEKVEILRRQRIFDGQATGASADADSVVGGNGQDRRRSSDSRLIKISPDQRKMSAKSLHSTDASEQDQPELESLRKKLMRAAIARNGHNSVELWRSAVRLVSISRLLQYIAPTTRVQHDRLPVIQVPHAVLPPTPMGERPDGSPEAEDNDYLTVGGLRATALLPPQSFCLAKVSSSDSVLTEVTNTPATPMLLQKPTHRKGAFSEGEDLHAVTNKLNILAIHSQDPLRFVKYQQNRLLTDRHGFRDRDTPCQLPQHLTMQIVKYLMTEREMSVMSEGQKKAALDWGQSRGTIATERDWLRKDASAQILMLLDRINCLAYAQTT